MVWLLVVSQETRPLRREFAAARGQDAENVGGRGSMYIVKVWPIGGVPPDVREEPGCKG